MSIDNLKPVFPPSAKTHEGVSIKIEKIEETIHHDGLEANICGPKNEHLWEYIPFGTVQNAKQLFTVLDFTGKTLGWISYALCCQRSGQVLGTLSLMRIRPEHASAEVGCVVFGDNLKKTTGATEAIYLLARYLFDELGYRRFEWKCDSQNLASQKAAERFGFSYEGTFRNDMIVKGRNRDTRWYSMTDTDWKKLKPAYEAWLSPDNFDQEGFQRMSLRQSRKTVSCLTSAPVSQI